MYSGSKENGSLVGRVRKSEAFDLADIAESTACEESLVCLDEEGNVMTMVSCLDPSSGALSWTPEMNAEAVTSRVLGCNQMPSMLHDVDRNNVFETAIKRLVNNFIHREGRAPSVLDVGAGTGLLSMMAARAGASNVLGCEMFDKMASVAEEVVRDNGLGETVKIVAAKSTDLEEGLNADLLISELLDSALLGESVMFSHADAVQRLLAPVSNSTTLPVEERVLPHSAEILCTLVQSDELERMHNIHGIKMGGCDSAESNDESNDTPWRNPWAERCRGGWQLLPLHWQHLHQRTMAAQPEITVELSEPTPVLSFEFFHENVAETPDSCCETDIVVTHSGKITGLLLYWKLWLLSPALDPNRELHYSTRPGDQNWQDHWVQVVYPLPESLDCQQGDVIRVTCTTDNLRIWIRADVQTQAVPSVVALEEVSPLFKRLKPDMTPLLSKHKRPLQRNDDTAPVECACGWHLLHSPDRLLMINDVSRKGKYESAISRCLESVAATLDAEHDQVAEYAPLVMDLADGSMLGLFAAHKLKRLGGEAQNRCRVVSKETKGMSAMFCGQLAEANGVDDIFSVWDGMDLAEISEIILRESDSDSEDGMDNEDEVENGSETSCDKMPHTPARIVLLFSDCYKYQMQARQVWQALSFHYERSSMQPLLAQSVRIVPARAQIMVAALQLTDLHISHGDVGVVAGLGEGFDHESFDRRQAGWHQNWLPYRLSDYAFEMLAGPAVLQELDYSRVASDLSPLEIDLQVIAKGRCDCVAVWVDYIMSDATANAPAVTAVRHFDGFSFPPYLKVSLRFFDEAQLVNPGLSIVRCKSSFQLGDSDLRYDFAVKVV